MTAWFTVEKLDVIRPILFVKVVVTRKISMKTLKLGIWSESENINSSAGDRRELPCSAAYCLTDRISSSSCE